MKPTKENTVIWENTNENEKLVWEGQPSQFVNLWIYIFCGFTFWLIIPLIVALIKWLEIVHLHYILTTERLRIISGILTKRIDDLELFRVKDTSYIEPFLSRKFKCGNVIVYSADSSHPTLKLHAVPNAYQLREKIRKLVLAERQKRGISEIDYYTANPTTQRPTL